MVVVKAEERKVNEISNMRPEKKDVKKKGEERDK